MGLIKLFKSVFLPEREAFVGHEFTISAYDKRHTVFPSGFRDLVILILRVELLGESSQYLHPGEFYESMNERLDDSEKAVRTVTNHIIETIIIYKDGEEYHLDIKENDIFKAIDQFYNEGEQEYQRYKVTHSDDIEFLQDVAGEEGVYFRVLNHWVCGIYAGITPKELLTYKISEIVESQFVDSFKACQIIAKEISKNYDVCLSGSDVKRSTVEAKILGVLAAEYLEKEKS